MTQRYRWTGIYVYLCRIRIEGLIILRHLKVQPTTHRCCTSLDLFRTPLLSILLNLLLNWSFLIDQCLVEKQDFIPRTHAFQHRFNIDFRPTQMYCCLHKFATLAAASCALAPAEGHASNTFISFAQHNFQTVQTQIRTKNLSCMAKLFGSSWDHPFKLKNKRFSSHVPFYIPKQYVKAEGVC